MPGQLGEQNPTDALYAESERSVLQYGFMSHIHEFSDEFTLIPAAWMATSAVRRSGKQGPEHFKDLVSRVLKDIISSKARKQEILVVWLNGVMYIL